MPVLSEEEVLEVLELQQEVVQLAEVEEVEVKKEETVVVGDWTAAQTH